MKKTLKALLAMLLALSCLIGCAACGEDDGKKDESDKDVIATSGESEEESKKDESKKDDEGNKKDDAAPALPKIPEYKDTDENGNPQRDPNFKPVNYEEMKGVWLSQFDMPSLYMAGNTQKNQQTFEILCDKVCKAVADYGFNTLIVQLRPNGDSFFPSDVYCSSKFVVGDYNKEFDYDMLQIFIKTAHKYGLSFHGWLNPMRLMSKADIAKVSTDYKIGEWYQDEAKRKAHLSESGGLYYLVPGVEENQQLVWDGVTELCRNYNVDAVHIDDYFYPTIDASFDREHFLTMADNYGGDTITALNTYRRDMVNKLVKGMYDAVKAVDEKMWFGISPAGSINNNVNTLFAQVNLWAGTPGYCDYIVPQVYWGFEHPTESCKFDVCCAEWEKYAKSDEVRLIIGIGIYRIGDEGEEWDEYRKYDDVTKRQLEYVESMKKCEGFVFYSIGDIMDATGRVKDGIIKKERKNFQPVLKNFGGENGTKVVE